jgi:hypothetical protein
MSHQCAGLTNTESHCGAAHDDGYLNCETALNCPALTMRERKNSRRVEQYQRQARLDAAADGLVEAGRAMQALNPPMQNVNMTVTCTFGCR